MTLSIWINPVLTQTAIYFLRYTNQESKPNKKVWHFLNKNISSQFLMEWFHPCWPELNLIVEFSFPGWWQLFDTPILSPLQMLSCF